MEHRAAHRIKLVLGVAVLFIVVPALSVICWPHNYEQWWNGPAELRSGCNGSGSGMHGFWGDDPISRRCVAYSEFLASAFVEVWNRFAGHPLLRTAFVALLLGAAGNALWEMFKLLTRIVRTPPPPVPSYKPLKAGILIIGSLLWDPERDSWRKRRRLQVGLGKPVQVPIRYGRRSTTRGNTFTMIFTSGAEMGTAVLGPAHHGMCRGERRRILGASVPSRQLRDRI